MRNKSSKMTNKSRKMKTRSRKMTNKSGKMTNKPRKSDSLKKLKKHNIHGGNKFHFRANDVEIEDTFITIENDEVIVSLDFRNSDKIDLLIFYNMTRRTNPQRGIARCALLFLINELERYGKINNNADMIVYSPTPIKNQQDNYIKNKPQLITFYKNMGFAQQSDGTLSQSVNALKIKLQQFCS